MRSACFVIGCVLALVSRAQQASDVSATERAKAVPAWGVTLVERERCVSESDVCDTTLYIEDQKKRRLLASGLTGPFVLLLKARKVLACESNEIMETKAPVMLDLNGEQTVLSPHAGYLRDCSVSDTGEEILLVYSLVDIKPYSLARVIDASGKLLVEKRLDTEGTVDFTVHGEPHKLRISEPEFPH